MSAVRLFAALAAVFVASPALAGSITISGSTTDAAYSNRVYSCPGTSCFIAPATLAGELAGGAVTVAASGDSGDVTVGEALSWTGSILTLSAGRNVNIAATVTHSGSGSGLVLRADSECRLMGGITAAAASISGNTTAYTHDAFVPGAVMASGTLTVWKLIDSTAELSLLPETGDFALGCDMTDPGGYASIPTFRGRLDGLGHAVIELRVAEGRGMFTVLDGATVTNLVLVRPNVTYSGGAVGTLAGTATGSKISGIAVLAGSVTATSGTGVGGLIGAVVASEVSSVYTSGSVSGGSQVGGIHGSLDGSGLIIGTAATLTNVMSKMTVTGSSNVGGLVGSCAANAAVAASIVDSWSAGAVTGMSGAGGAVGSHNVLFCSGTSLYWDTTTSGQATSALGTARNNTQMKRAASFAGFDIPGTWIVREDVGRPFLASMRSLLDVTVNVTGSAPTLATQPASFSATVAMPAGAVLYETGTATVRGQVRFLDSTTLIATTQLTNGSAAATTSALTVGTHVINAVYDGNDYHIENFSSVGHTVSKSQTTIAIENTAGPINATVSPVAPATGNPGGTITFIVDGEDRTPPVAVSNRVATLDPSSLGAGTFLVSARYNGDTFFDASAESSAITVLVVGPTSTALGQSLAVTQLGEAFDLNAVVTSSEGVPTGTVRFIADGATLLAETTLSAGVANTSITTLSGGTHTIVAQYIPADANFTASVSPPITHDVTKAESITNILVADIHDGYVTLNVEVAAGIETLPTPSGNILVTIDGADVGDAELVDGIASFDSDQLSRGSHIVSARYEGDGNYNGSVSAELEVTIELEGFRFVATPRKGTTFAGGSVPVTLSLTPENGTFTEQVTFACENLPPGVTCAFSPVAVNVAPAGTTVGLLINTQRAVAAAGLTLPRVPPVYVVPFVALAAGLYVITRRRKVAYLALALTAFACGSSGGDGDPTEGTPPGTYAITVKAQGQTITRTTTVEIEVR